MKRAIFFVLLLVMEPVSFSQNLVLNPGFETWSKINRPSGWNHVEKCLKDSSFVISGNYSCLHGCDATSTSDLGQTIPVTEGREYSLSFYCKTIITSSGNGARLWCYWKDDEGKSIEDLSTKPLLRPSDYMVNDTWQQFIISITAPPEAVSFYLEVRTYQNSVAYWDDFVFEEIITTNYQEATIPVISVYPNPVSDYLTINNMQNLQHIDIHNIAGTTVWSGNFSGEKLITIPVTGFSDGLYIIRITSSGKNITRKFIKNTK